MPHGGSTADSPSDFLACEPLPENGHWLSLSHEETQPDSSCPQGFTILLQTKLSK
jgi:hypothetical protein